VLLDLREVTAEQAGRRTGWRRHVIDWLRLNVLEIEGSTSEACLSGDFVRPGGSHLPECTECLANRRECPHSGFDPADCFQRAAGLTALRDARRHGAWQRIVGDTVNLEARVGIVSDRVLPPVRTTTLALFSRWWRKGRDAR